MKCTPVIHSSSWLFSILSPTLRSAQVTTRKACLYWCTSVLSGVIIHQCHRSWPQHSSENHAVRWCAALQFSSKKAAPGMKVFEFVVLYWRISHCTCLIRSYIKGQCRCPSQVSSFVKFTIPGKRFTHSCCHNYFNTQVVYVLGPLLQAQQEIPDCSIVEINLALS